MNVKSSRGRGGVAGDEAIIHPTEALVALARLQVGLLLCCSVPDPPPPPNRSPRVIE